MERLKYNKREIVFGGFFLIFLLSLTVVPWQDGILNTNGWRLLLDIFLSIFQPDLSPEIVTIAFTSLWETFAYALISVSLAIIASLILGFLASGVIFKARWVSFISRRILGFLRSIHELIWAWIFVAAIGLNPIGAIFALAIPYTGYIGKIFADTLEEVDDRLIEAMRINGASKGQLILYGKGQLILYGYLPQAFPSMLSYALYRLECAIRSSSVLSFIGLGGIGFYIQLALRDLNFNELWTYLYVLIALIIAINYWGGSVRRRSHQLKQSDHRFIKWSTLAFLVLVGLSWIYFSVFTRCLGESF